MVKITKIIPKSEGGIVSRKEIENILPFTREEYEEKRALSKKEIIDYDDFIENIIFYIEEGEEEEDVLKRAVNEYKNIK